MTVPTLLQCPLAVAHGTLHANRLGTNHLRTSTERSDNSFAAVDITNVQPPRK